MWPPEYRSFLQEWGRYTWLCGEIRWAVGLDSPRANELHAAEAALSARVRAVNPFAYEEIGELRPLFREGVTRFLDDPDLPPEYRNG